METTYRRSQAEYALWGLHGRGKARQSVPRAFRNRVKKLLDADRVGEMPNSEASAAPFAFSEEAPGGTGVDAAFTAFDVTCLAYALEMVGFGFKPSEVVFLLRHIRGDLYDEIVGNDRLPRRAQSSSTNAELCIFLLIKRVDVSGDYLEQTTKGPLFLEPTFCHGPEQFAKAFSDFGQSQRSVFVLELAWPAALVREQLAKAPLIKRGVKS